MAELIVDTSFLGVSEHFISFRGFFELIFGILVTRISIGVTKWLKIISRKRRKLTKCLETPRKEASTISSAIKDWKAAASPDLADLMIFFQVLATYLKSFSASAVEAVNAAAVVKVQTCATI